MNPIGHSSPAFSHLALKEVADEMARDQFDVWEIVAEGRHFLPDCEKALADLLPSYSFRVQAHAPMSDINVGSLNPRAWEVAVAAQADTIRAAGRLGIERVTIHPGNHSPYSRGHYPELHEATRRALLRLDPVARDAGVALCLENMATGWAFETDSWERVADLAQGTELSFCLDIGHAHVAKRMSEFLAVARRFGNVHIHDNKGTLDDHLTLGDGDVPWKEAASRLVSAGYSGTFVIESRDFASGRKSRTHLRQALMPGA